MTDTSKVFPFCLVSGFRPIGHLHIGHYGAVIKDIVELQYVRPQAAHVLIADHHARSEWRSEGDRGIGDVDSRSILVGKQLLALGVNPEFTTIYKQSDVPSVFEVMWLLSGITSDGDLRRNPAYKETEAPTVGVFLYPMLMIADILGMKATNVAIGKDQSKHLDLARDVAVQLVRFFGRSFCPIPESVRKPLSTVKGYRGDRKMEVGVQNAICIFEDEAQIKNTINRIVTRNVERGVCLPDKDCPILAYAEAIAGADGAQFIAENYSDPTYRYKHAKEDLEGLFFRTFAEPRERVRSISDDTVRDWLSSGAALARQRMAITVDELRSRLCLSV